MKKKLFVRVDNEFDLEITRSHIPGNTWYFVHWNMDEKDNDGYYTIYTFQKTFNERVAVFKSKEWEVVCKVGNMLNGLFHRYFEISNSYPLAPTLCIDELVKNIK